MRSNRLLIAHSAIMAVPVPVPTTLIPLLEICCLQNSDNIVQYIKRK